MKQVILALLTALLAVSGTAGEPLPSLNATPLSFQTTTRFDPKTNVQRTTLDPQGCDLEVYFEVPIFEEDGAGYERINAFFYELNAAFFTPENGNIETLWQGVTVQNAGDPPYHYRRDARVTTRTEQLVSVTITYDWYAGGVADYGSDSYTFRTDTGELLALTDVAEGSEEELRAMIEAALKEQDGGAGVVEIGQARTRALDEFEFYVQDGRVFLPFDKYEAAFGAYGGFVVELPAALKEF